MLGGLKVIIRFEFGKVGNVFQTAVSIRRVHGESPVAAGLRRGAHRQPDEHTRGVLAAEFIANKKLFGGPGLGHFFDVGDAGGSIGGVRQQGTRLWSWRRNFDLRLRSEEHSSELQSRSDLVCRLLLEKKKTEIVIKLINHYSTDDRCVI